MPLSDGLNGDLDGCFHEGSIAALMDTTAALAAWSAVPLEMHKASTPSLHVNFFRKAAFQEVYALAGVRWQRQELFLNDVHIVDAENGSTIADGTVLYRIVQKSSHN
jgi:acyl-coenzyme A thioesterase PaaI-like protein